MVIQVVLLSDRYLIRCRYCTFFVKIWIYGTIYSKLFFEPREMLKLPNDSMDMYYSALNRNETLVPSAEVIDKPSSSLHNLSSAALIPSNRCIKRMVT